jgi:chemotaxis protein methyltransferase CheR
MIPTAPTKTPESGLLSPANYAFLLAYIRRESGIALGDDKLYLIRTRLEPVMTANQCGTLDELCEKLRTRPAPALCTAVVEAMTTHETLFFRDSTVYDALKTTLLPSLVRSRQATRTLRIWSAACSSGQEPYSIAMMLLEMGYGDWKIDILGTDLSNQILKKAAAATYLQIEVNRGLPAPLLVKYFVRSGLNWQLKDDVRRMVRFQRCDLRQNLQPLGAFDLVLCRNVLIYFEQDTRRSILSSIQKLLVPGGYLLLGASETTFNLEDTLIRTTAGGIIAFQSPFSGARQ